jgi:amino acid efflux transporter
MPSAAIVAGKYVQELWITHPYVSIIVPFSMILITITTTLYGIKTSAKLNTMVTILLILVGLTLFLKTSSNIHLIKVPEFSYNWKNIMNSSVLAFWAFAGFENMTFLSNNFQNPKRDLLISASIAIVVCGLLYLGLTFNISVLMKQEEINSSLGLMQLADFIKPAHFSKLIIAMFAFFAVMVNLISWTAGISNAIVSASKKRMLPSSLGVLKSGVPKNAILALGCAFCISTAVGITSSETFNSMLALVSSNFLVIYLLSLLSYSRFTSNKLKKYISLFLSIGILIVLLSYKWLLIYPLVLIAVSIIYSKSIQIKGHASEI